MRDFGKATFTAPAIKLTPNVVSVSVQHTLGVDPVFQLLVSSVTIVEELSCQAMRSVERFDAALAFDEFAFSASIEDHTYSGRHSGLLEGTLTKALPDAGPQPPFDVRPPARSGSAACISTIKPCCRSRQAST